MPSKLFNKSSTPNSTPTDSSTTSNKGSVAGSSLSLVSAVARLAAQKTSSDNQTLALLVLVPLKSKDSSPHLGVFDWTVWVWGKRSSDARSPVRRVVAPFVVRPGAPTKVGKKKAPTGVLRRILGQQLLPVLSTSALQNSMPKPPDASGVDLGQRAAALPVKTGCRTGCTARSEVCGIPPIIAKARQGQRGMSKGGRVRSETKSSGTWT